MNFFLWSQFATVCIIGAMSPGPSLLVVIRNSTNINRLSGILTSIGHGIGIGLYATIAVLGLGIVLDSYQSIFILIQILGLIFLFFLVYTYIFNEDTEEPIIETQNQINSFFQGFSIAIINPKILIWFTAIYSQFIFKDADALFNIILILTASIIDAIWYIFISIMITNNHLKNILIGRKSLIQKITGIILLIIALFLLYNLILSIQTYNS